MGKMVIIKVFRKKKNEYNFQEFLELFGNIFCLICSTVKSTCYIVTGARGGQFISG